MEFWNSEITETSWKTLKRLKGEVRFILIGGWAVYLYTHLEKSKGIDIIVDYDALKSLNELYELNKNQKLSKYQIKLGDLDIDVYVPYYSKLSVPPEDIIASSRSVEGFMLPSPEMLLVLKLGALNARRASIKGQKDAVDILGLLLYSDLDKNLVKSLCAKYRVNTDAIKDAVKNVDDDTLAYLNTNRHHFSKARKQLIELFQ